MKRNRWTWGTKKHAPAAAIAFLRGYAKVSRKCKLTPFGFGREAARHDEMVEQGKALGAVSALWRCGLLTQAQYDRYFNRIGRINSAKVTRRPFELLAAA